MDRRDVAWIVPKIRRIISPGIIREEKSDRPAVFLLRTAVANALGLQTLLIGTAHGSKDDQAPARGELLEFTSEFAHRTEGTKRNIWKGHRILVTSSVNDDSYRGSVPAGWNRSFSKRLAALLSDEGQARLMLSSAPMPPPALRQHPTVRGLAPASVVRYRNKLAFVISNAEIHSRHPYAPVIVSPIVERSELGRHTNLAICLGQDRVAYEVSQTIEPLDDEVFEVLQQPCDATTAILAPVRAAASTLLLGESPRQQRSGEFLAYLTESGTELRQRSLYHLGSLAEATGYGLPPKRLALHRVLPPTGRFLDTGEDAIGGRDFFQLPTGLPHFDIWLERLESLTHLQIEAKSLPSNCIEHAWLEDAQGKIIASFEQDEEVDEVGFITLPAGKITANSEQSLRLGICSPLGIAMLDLKMSWGLAGSA